MTSKRRAEFSKKYFWRMKFCTLVLISLWKTVAFLSLTTQFSVV